MGVKHWTNTGLWTWGSTSGLYPMGNEMNDEQVKTQEFIFRNRENGSGVKETKKKGNFKAIAAAVAVVIFSGIAIFALVLRNKAEDAALAGNGSKEVVADTEKEESETIADNNDITPTPAQDKAELTPTAALVAEEPTTAPTEAPTATHVPEKETENEPEEIIMDEEVLGLFGSAQDVLDIYRADDPELPSYLKMTVNEKFKMNLSAEELELFCHLVEAEAPAEDIYGRILVANVVLNRVVTKGWANTVTGVIYEKCGNSVQFSSTVMKSYWNSIKISDLTREAVMRALAGEDYSDGAIFFFAWRKHPELTPTTGWISAYKYLFKHGGHAFYK